MSYIPQVHKFNSTGEAYCACLTNSDVRTGDVLVIESEQVIGLACAYPVALTLKNHGELHTIDPGRTEEEVFGEMVKYATYPDRALLAMIDGATLAENIAIGYGWDTVYFAPEFDEPSDGYLSDAEADADVLASAGWGTDEDYGYVGDDY